MLAELPRETHELLCKLQYLTQVFIFGIESLFGDAFFVEAFAEIPDGSRQAIMVSTESPIAFPTSLIAPF